MEIEKGHKIPAAGRKSELSQLAVEMQVGDSVFTEDYREATRMREHLFNYGLNDGTKGRSRKVVENGREGWRIWKVRDEKLDNQNGENQ